jgi:hypothetical protein
MPAGLNAFQALALETEGDPEITEGLAVALASDTWEMTGTAKCADEIERAEAWARMMLAPRHCDARPRGRTDAPEIHSRPRCGLSIDGRTPYSCRHGSSSTNPCSSRQSPDVRRLNPCPAPRYKGTSVAGAITRLRDKDILKRLGSSWSKRIPNWQRL